MIKRHIFKEIKEHLKKKEITLLIGPRQAGKTSLMKALMRDAEEKQTKTLFLSLDIDENKPYLENQMRLVEKIKLHMGTSGGIVFLDEIQRKKDAGLFLKGLYDMDLPYKFVVSGSGSLELKEQIHESLVGRKRVFEVTTLSFVEFVHYKTAYAYEEKLEDFIRTESEKTQALLKEYVTYGGYPRVVASSTIQEKTAEIAEIYQSYLEKYIKDLLHLDKSDALTRLLKIIASQIGGMVNFSEIASTVGISEKTVKKYVWYLEKTFILYRLSPFFTNVRKEVSKSPVFYFHDIGLRNYMLGLFTDFSAVETQGHVFENFVYKLLLHRIRHSSSKIHYWRSRDDAEVDFILSSGVMLTPYEVKFAPKAEMTRSFAHFISKYHPQYAYVVYMGEARQASHESTSVQFVHFGQLLNVEDNQRDRLTVPK